MISANLLLLAAMSPLIIFMAHALAYRLFGVERKISSPQIFLIRLIVFLNLPMGILSWAQENRNVWMLLFIAIVFNGFAYAYFHFFNMSETSQRIRLLILMRMGSAPTAADTPQDEAIGVRLRRLIQMRQVSVDEGGRYRITGRFFLNVAGVIRGIRRLFGMEKAIS